MAGDRGGSACVERCPGPHSPHSQLDLVLGRPPSGAGVAGHVLARGLRCVYGQPAHLRGAQGPRDQTARCLQRGRPRCGPLARGHRRGRGRGRYQGGADRTTPIRARGVRAARGRRRRQRGGRPGRRPGCNERSGGAGLVLPVYRGTCRGRSLLCVQSLGRVRYMGSRGTFRFLAPCIGMGRARGRRFELARAG